MDAKADKAAVDKLRKKMRGGGVGDKKKGPENRANQTTARPITVSEPKQRQ